MKPSLNKIVVAGAGTMGSGIAQVFAQAGCQTFLVDTNVDQLKIGLDRIESSMRRLAAKGKIAESEIGTTLARITTSSHLNAAPEAELFIEAVPEDLALKATIFEKADAIFVPSTILASNTSGLSITKLAAHTKRSHSVIGLHFFNPVPVMKLLEVVVGQHTSKHTVEMAQSIATLLEKEAIIVSDSPGFATSRLGICLAFEAIRMLESKVASVEDIDKAMSLGYGHPMGPLKLTDLVGLDVRLAIGENLFESLGQSQFRPPQLLKEMVALGRLGQKSGRGFYPW